MAGHCGFTRPLVQEIFLKNATLRTVNPAASHTSSFPALVPTCALLALSLFTRGALAQAQVTDPAAPVPSVVYQTVFADTPKGVEMQTADWTNANAEVAQFKRGHVDILKWEDAQAKNQLPIEKQLPTRTQIPPQVPDATKFVAPNMHKH